MFQNFNIITNKSNINQTTKKNMIEFSYWKTKQDLNLIAINFFPHKKHTKKIISMYRLKQ